MAKQGNYVTVPGASQNWASGASGALADLSKTLYTQSAEEEERARLLRLEEKSDARYADEQERLEQSRLDTLAWQDKQYALSVNADQRAQAEAAAAAKLRAEQRATQNWIKGMGSKVDIYTLREKIALDAGFDPSQYSEEEAKKYISKAPIYQEDVYKQLSPLYVAQTGKALDPAMVASMFPELKSLKTEQERATAAARARQEQQNKAAEHALDVYEVMGGITRDQNGNIVRSNKKASSSKIPDSNVALARKEFTGKDTFWFELGESSKEKGRNIFDLMDDVNAKLPENERYTPAQIAAAKKHAVEKFTKGSELNEIDADRDEVIKALKEGAEKVQQDTGQSLPFRTEDLRFQRFIPPDVRVRDLTAWSNTWKKASREEREQILNKGTTSSGDVLTNNIMNNLGLGGVAANTADDMNGRGVLIPGAPAGNPTSSTAPVQPERTDLENSRAYQYAQQKALADQFRGMAEGYRYKDLGIPTLQVLTTDETGRPLSWDKVTSIANNSRVPLEYKISEKEYRQAANDPAMQEVLVGRVNEGLREVLQDGLTALKKRVKMATYGNKVGLTTSYGPGNYVQRPFDPTSQAYQDSLKRQEERKALNTQREQVSSRIEEFLSRY